MFYICGIFLVVMSLHADCIYWKGFLIMWLVWGISRVVKRKNGSAMKIIIILGLLVMLCGCGNTKVVNNENKEFIKVSNCRQEVKEFEVISQTSSVYRLKTGSGSLTDVSKDPTVRLSRHGKNLYPGFRLIASNEEIIGIYIRVKAIKRIKIATYIHKDFPDIEETEELEVTEEKGNFYTVRTIKAGRPWFMAETYYLPKNPKVKIERKSYGGYKMIWIGLWEDGDRVKEGKIREEPCK